MPPDEREELQDLLVDCTRSDVGALGPLAGALTALTVALVATVHPGILLATTLLGGIAGGLAVRACSGRRSLRDALWRDLRGGIVQVIQVAPRDVIRLTGPHGDVAGYFA